ncbi:C40 family peptidase [Kitasatospora sp. NPDC003701]
MNTGSKFGLGLASATVVTGIALLTTFGGADSASAKEAGPGGGISTDAPVPGWVRDLINKHAGLCPQVTASLLAAQLYTESNFNPDAVSPVGALGIAQFMPGTWAEHGQDGDGDGIKDIRNPADAIAAQAKYDCTLAKEVKDVPGDSTENMLAAYNAGGGAVIKYGGIPPYEETRNYVRSIRDLAAKWADAVQPNLPAGEGAARAISAAKTALGTWYLWGGPCESPYTGGSGCDCSSLTKMAWASAGVNLPRVTYDQVRAGTAVASISQLAPGDLLFSVPGDSGPEHVGMYIGNNEVIDAPHTGAQVRIQPLSVWTPQIIAMRHVG